MRLFLFFSTANYLSPSSTTFQHSFYPFVTSFTIPYTCTRPPQMNVYCLSFPFAPSLTPVFLHYSQHVAVHLFPRVSLSSLHHVVSYARFPPWHSHGSFQNFLGNIHYTQASAYFKTFLFSSSTLSSCLFIDLSTLLHILSDTTNSDPFPFLTYPIPFPSIPFLM